MQIKSSTKNIGINFMRVLMVFSSSEIGGAERSLTRIALTSPTGVYQLATLDGEGPWCDWVRREGQKPLVFGVRNGARHGRLRVGAILSLLHHVRSEGNKIVYICGVRASLWLRLLKPFMPGVKLVHGVRTNPDSNLYLDRFFRVLERWLNGLIDLYITNSQISATTLIKRCGVSEDKIEVIHNGLSEMPTDILPLVERPLNVLTVANLIPYKGHLEYLLVIERVLEAVPDVHFTFVGRDDMNGKVQSAIIARKLSERVSYVGFQQDISSWMRVARLLVVPSLKEGFPTVVLEAMSHGMPVAAYDIGGLPELVRHEEDGLLVPAGDTKCLANAIIKLLKETDNANKMSALALARSEADFPLKICVMKHQEALRLLMKG
jgi:glycosyltransferase involved in cell wall biosynthesis